MAKRVLLLSRVEFYYSVEITEFSFRLSRNRIGIIVYFKKDSLAVHVTRNGINFSVR